MKMSEDFPRHDGGKVVFQRDWFIKKTADLVLVKQSGEYDSYYWRAPLGAGKSVFLRLIGRELQNRGCVVYLTAGKLMEEYHQNFFPNLAKEAGNKTMVLLVDEVQHNLDSKHWLVVLKGCRPTNLLVLGVGVPQLFSQSPQFDHKFPEEGDSFPMFLTREDLPEVCAHFQQGTSPSQPKEVAARVCEEVLKFTAGHLFPFVKFVSHLLDSSNKIDLTDIDHYLAGEEFRSSPVCVLVQKRCFDFLTGDNITQAENVLLNKGSSGDRKDLVKLGIWSQEGAFISPLLTTEVFLHMKVRRSDEQITLVKPTITPYAQQVICAGLRDMVDADFKDAHYDIDAVENAVGFRWGYNVKSALSEVWVAPQVRTKNVNHVGRGPKPVIDFFFNGRMNMGIELALNQKATGIREHLERFDNNYKDHKENGVVLHFQTENATPVTEMKEPYNTAEAKNRIYTYVKKSNELYRGTCLVKSNVTRLPSPPKTRYSTYAFGCLRRVMKSLK
jgi:hypothetical protein